MYYFLSVFERKLPNNIGKFKAYNDMSNILSYNTTNLSAGLNMGCISIRETYWSIKIEFV